MEQLGVTVGCAARDALCAAFDAAHVRIDAEFYSISDPAVIASLNAAARRHVEVNLHVDGHPSRFGRKPDTGEKADRASSSIADLRKKLVEGVHLVIEDDPNVVMHSKAAVVDAHTAFIATANPTKCGFGSPGEVLISDASASDVAAVEASIVGSPAPVSDYVISGPTANTRSRMTKLLGSSSDLRVATEDLSDPQVINSLVVRSAAGHHDRVLLEANYKVSRTQYQALSQLSSAGIDVRTLPSGFMHEKYVDAGDEIYVGSANLTRNGLDEAREIGVVAPAAVFGTGADSLRTDFDGMWSRAISARNVTVHLRL